MLFCPARLSKLDDIGITPLSVGRGRPLMTLATFVSATRTSQGKTLRQILWLLAALGLLFPVTYDFCTYTIQ